MSLFENLLRALATAGFSFVPADQMRDLFQNRGAFKDWSEFTSSWNRLETDTHMGDNGTYRKRRYAVFRCEKGRVSRCKHQAHYQDLNFNALNGGYERWFEPFEDNITQNESLLAIITLCEKVFSALMPESLAWHVEAHQIRIESGAEHIGHPTPEGIHRDGRDFVLVLMICRQNIESGVTTIYGPDAAYIGSFTLTQTFDAAWLDDRRVHHGVTAVTPLDICRPAYRDVLVLTFKNIDH